MSEFDPEEQVALTLAIIAINGWNRLSGTMRSELRECRFAVQQDDYATAQSSESTSACSRTSSVARACLSGG